MCLAFRNAAPYLGEWLLFHAASGVDYFLLYDNDSTDDFRPVVQPWIDAGRAELVPWPGYYQQMAIYDDSLGRARGRFTWLAFIDDDEFLFDVQGALLAEVLEGYADQVAALAVSWYLFGSAGRLRREPDLVIRRFQRRCRWLDQHHKCIVRPDRVTRSLAGGHLFETSGGYPILGQRGGVVTTATTPHPQEGRLRLHHYLTKSLEEMTERRTSRDIGTGDRPKLPLEQWLQNERGWNDVEDAAALVLLPRMQAIAAAMGMDFGCAVGCT